MKENKNTMFDPQETIYFRKQVDFQKETIHHQLRGNGTIERNVRYRSILEKHGGNIVRLIEA